MLLCQPRRYQARNVSLYPGWRHPQVRKLFEPDHRNIGIQSNESMSNTLPIGLIAPFRHSLVIETVALAVCGRLPVAAARATVRARAIPAGHRQIVWVNPTWLEQNVYTLDKVITRTLCGSPHRCDCKPVQRRDAAHRAMTNQPVIDASGSVNSFTAINQSDHNAAEAAFTGTHGTRSRSSCRRCEFLADTRSQTVRHHSPTPQSHIVTRAVYALL